MIVLSDGNFIYLFLFAFLMRKGRSNRYELGKHASQTLNQIRSQCKKNQEGEVIQTTYKPLLFESAELDRGRMRTAKKTTARKRANFSELNRGLKCLTSASTMLNRNSQMNFYDDPLTLFLSHLYKQKTQDLKNIPNPKQEMVFVHRLKNKITVDRFEAVQCDFGKHSAGSIMKYLELSQVKVLVLDRNPLGDEGIIKLCQVFSKMKLVELSLVSINISCRGGKQLMKSIIGIKSLVTVNFSSPEAFNRNRFNPEGIEPMKKVLGHDGCSLKSISLSNVSMGEMGFTYLCESFSEKNNHLLNCNLSMNEIKINKEGYTLYSRMNFLFLQKLDLSSNCFGDRGLQFFADLLGINYGRNHISVSLKSLNLSKNGIKSYYFEAFCYQMVKNKTLEELNLSFNKLSQGQHFHHFKYLLTHNWSIQNLNLKNSITEQTDLKTLAQGLGSNRSVRHLNISENTFEEDSFIAFMAAIVKNRSLKNIKLEKCNIVDKFIEKSISLFKHNRGIESIDLGNNFLHDRGAKLLLRALMENHKIGEMNLKRNCIGLNYLQEIDQMLKENKISKIFQQPDLQYFNQISKVQETQKRGLMENIESLEHQLAKLQLNHLVYDIVETQNEIFEQAKKIQQEESNLTNLQTTLKKHSPRERESDNNFMLTS